MSYLDVQRANQTPPSTFTLIVKSQNLPRFVYNTYFSRGGGGGGGGTDEQFPRPPSLLKRKLWASQVVQMKNIHILQ